jgi:alpha-glucosidase (family GH31 glycosyl hydrolase)
LFKTDIGIWTGDYTNFAQAQDWYVKNDLTLGVTDLTTVSIGGVVDIYVILGYSPKQIIQNYWNYIVGKPVLVPLYSLGWN